MCACMSACWLGGVVGCCVQTVINVRVKGALKEQFIIFQNIPVHYLVELDEETKATLKLSGDHQCKNWKQGRTVVVLQDVATMLCFHSSVLYRFMC